MWEETSAGPTRSDRRKAGQPAQIHRIELNGPHVKKFVIEIAGDLAHNLWLADAAWAPDVQSTRSPISAWSAS